MPVPPVLLVRPRRPGRRLPAPLLGTACLAALLGCAQVQVMMGLRTPLEKVPVVALRPALAEGPGMAPGSKAHLVVTVTFDPSARPYLGAVHCGTGGPVPVFIEGTVPPLW
jgi:hypothetical protein